MFHPVFLNNMVWFSFILPGVFLVKTLAVPIPGFAFLEFF